MPVARFDGTTFVAFTDIAGFKSMMSDGTRAPLVLDAFYTVGYNVLRDHRNGGGASVDGFFLSA